MSSNDLNLDLPPDFDGQVRLFPLPNLVLFPGVVQALHLFEPRYLEMMEDALASDQLITMARLEDRKSTGVDTPAEIASTVCIGRILSHAQHADGRYNLFLLGIQRAKIQAELPSDFSFRVAQVDVLQEQNLLGSEALRQDLIHKYKAVAQLDPLFQQQALDQLFEQLLDPSLPLARLTDLVCYSCGAQPRDQQRALEMVDVNERTRFVIGLLDLKLAAAGQPASSNRKFPPDFSLN